MKVNQNKYVNRAFSRVSLHYDKCLGSKLQYARWNDRKLPVPRRQLYISFDTTYPFMPRQLQNWHPVPPKQLVVSFLSASAFTSAAQRDYAAHGAKARKFPSCTLPCEQNLLGGRVRRFCSQGIVRSKPKMGEKLTSANEANKKTLHFLSQN